MSKKEYIIRLMDSLSGKRALARGLKILVEGNLLGENTIEKLIETFSKAIGEVNDIKLKSVLMKSQKFLEKLRDAEIESRKKDDQEILELEQMLKNI